MSDRHIDIELIMALVDGSLPADEAAAAEASLDDAARAELAEQRSIRAALADIEPLGMSHGERADLRAGVRRELNLDAPRTVAPGRAPAPWYWRALPVLGGAAALILVIGIGVNNGIPLGGSGDDAESAETVAATEATTASAQFSEESIEQSDLLTSEAAPSAGDQSTETTTAATAASTTAATEAAASDGGFFERMMVPDDLGEISLDDLDALTETVDEGAKRILDFAPLQYSDVVPATAEPGLVCGAGLLDNLTEAAEVDYFGRAAISGEPVEVYRVFDLDIFSIYVLVEADCSIAAIVTG